MLIVIGTKPSTGQGGISNALAYYLEALSEQDIRYIMCSSHTTGTGYERIKIFLSAFFKVWLLLRACKKAHETPILYLHIGPWFSMLRKLVFVATGRLYGAKVICHLHSLSIDKYLRHPLGRLCCIWYLHRMDKVLVLTKWWKNRLQTVGIWNIEIIPNPVGKNFEWTANNSGAENKHIHNHGSTRILSMTRLVPGKGVDLVIQAMKHLPHNYNLTIAGTGSEKNALERLAHSNDIIDRVNFLGWVSGDDRLKILEEHDIFALPSQNDSFGMGFIEAMAFGLPVVALNSGPIADVVPNKIAGLLIDEPDPKLLAEAIRELESADIRRKMGVHAQRWVAEQYSLKTVGMKLKEVLLSLNS